MRRPVSPSTFEVAEDNEELIHLTSSDGMIEKQKFTHLNKRSKAALSFSRIYSVALHFLAVGLAVSLWSRNRHSRGILPAQGRSWSPVNDLVQYELNSEHPVDHDKHSQYAGPPAKDNDAAWDSLMRPVHFNATREELERAGESMSNIAELEGGGYPASLGVYHELHCVRQMRFYLYQEHYYPNLTEAQHEYLRGHLDHCLETLRLATMCRGSADVYSFYWNGTKTGKPATQSNAKSVCVKWSSIEGWAYSRMPTTTRLVEQTQENGQLEQLLEETLLF
ncbi:hypothetical protein J3458_012984 [Metarhizium acridum]|uniref:uncharacterized protein n=1 Tax=Metarhizium acridum TaxID=92637 RepID=UPI001C6C449A|nr:hypothetical protein J3458_012984 [Metarhizium acridum]